MTKDEQQKLNDALIAASKQGKLELVKELIEKGADVTSKGFNGNTPLHLAAQSDYIDVVTYLIEEVHVAVDIRNDHKDTPLHFAALQGHVDMVKYLCEMGADIDARNSNDWTPLHKAVAWKHLETVKYLFLERNALIPIVALFTFQKFLPFKKKMGRETDAQSILDYFLQNKSKYKPEEIQEFKEKFLDCKMSEEDSKNLKSIVKFL